MKNSLSIRFLLIQCKKSLTQLIDIMITEINESNDNIGFEIDEYF